MEITVALVCMVAMVAVPVAYGFYKIRCWQSELQPGDMVDWRKGFLIGPRRKELNKYQSRIGPGPFAVQKLHICRPYLQPKHRGFPVVVISQHNKDKKHTVPRWCVRKMN